MKRILYRIMKKDMINKLAKKHGEQFIDDVMETFEMPTNLMDQYQKAPDENYCRSMELYLNDLKIEKKLLENEWNYIQVDNSLSDARLENVKKRLDVLNHRMIDATDEIQEMTNSDLPQSSIS